MPKTTLKLSIAHQVQRRVRISVPEFPTTPLRAMLRVTPGPIIAAALNAAGLRQS
jgi:hypothetical protein